MVNVSYSRLSLGDVATKLGLDSAEDAEYIVAKAVRDGVVDATINHQDKFVTSNEVTDIYSSTEPHDAFHQRISFCLSLHNDLVKSMRYPPNAYRRYLEDPEVRSPVCVCVCIGAVGAALRPVPRGGGGRGAPLRGPRIGGELPWARLACSTACTGVCRHERRIAHTPRRAHAHGCRARCSNARTGRMRRRRSSRAWKKRKTTSEQHGRVST